MKKKSMNITKKIIKKSLAAFLTVVFVVYYMVPTTMVAYAAEMPETSEQTDNTDETTPTEQGTPEVVEDTVNANEITPTTENVSQLSEGIEPADSETEATSADTSTTDTSEGALTSAPVVPEEEPIEELEDEELLDEELLEEEDEVIMTFVEAPSQLETPQATFIGGILSGLNADAAYYVKLSSEEQEQSINADLTGSIDFTTMNLSGVTVEYIIAAGDYINSMDSEPQTINGFIPIKVTINKSAGVNASSLKATIIQEDGSFNITLSTIYNVFLGDSIMVNGTLLSSGNSYAGVTYTMNSTTSATITGTPTSDIVITGVTGERENQMYPIYSADGSALFIIKQSINIRSNLQNLNGIKIRTLDGEYGEIIRMQEYLLGGEGMFYVTGLTDAVYVIQPQYADGTVGETICMQGYAPVVGTMDVVKDPAHSNYIYITGVDGMPTSSQKNSVWYCEANTANTHVYTYAYMSGPNTVKVVIVPRVLQSTYGNCSIWFYGRLNFGNNQKVNICYDSNHMVRATDGTNVLTIQHGVGDNIVNGYNPVTGVTTPAILRNWWGYESSHPHNRMSNTLYTANTTILNPIMNCSVQVSNMNGYETRVYTLNMTLGEFDEEVETPSIIPTKQYTISGENFTIFNGSATGTLNDVETKSVTITADEGYALTDTIMVGTQTLEDGITQDGVTYEKIDDITGRITFCKSSMAENTVVEVQAGAYKFYTFTTANVTVATGMESGDLYQGTITVNLSANASYKLPYEIMVGETTISAGSTVNGITYIRTGHTEGTITMYADSMEEINNISIAALLNVQYSMEINHIATDPATTSGEICDGSLAITLNANEGYILPSYVSVMEEPVAVGETLHGVTYIKDDEYHGSLVLAEEAMEPQTTIQAEAIKIKSYSIDTYYAVVANSLEDGEVITDSMVVTISAQNGKELADSIMINNVSVQEGTKIDGVLYERTTPATGTIAFDRDAMQNDTEIFVSAKLRLRGQLTHTGLMQGTITLMSPDGDVIGISAITPDGHYDFYYDPTQSDYILVTNVIDGQTQRSALTGIEIETIENSIMVNGNAINLQDGCLIQGTNAGADRITAFNAENQKVNVQSTMFVGDGYLIAGAENVMYVIANDGSASSYNEVLYGTENGYLTGNVDLTSLVNGSILMDDSVIHKADNSIAAGASINIMDAEGNIITTTTTNAEGGFILSGIQNGSDYTMVITVTSPMMQSYVRECSFTCEDGIATLSTSLPDVITLRRVFSGIVSNGESSVADVEVYILNSSDEQIGHTVTLPDGSYYLSVPGNGNYLAIATTGAGEDEICGTTLITVTNLHPTSGDIAILPGHLAYGHISPAMANVEVRVRNAQTEELIVRTKTNVDGNFCVGGMQTDTEYLITAAGYGRSGSQYVATSDEMVDIIPETLTFMDEIAMTSGLMLAGTVKDSNGTPVEGATVVIRDVNGTLLASVTTNQQGNYSYSEFKGGTCYLIASNGTMSGDSTITITQSGMITAGSKNIVMKEGSVVRGRIRGTNHIGMNGVTITFIKNGQIVSTTKSLKDGWFFATGLVEGEDYEVELAAEGTFGGTANICDVCVTSEGGLYPNTYELEPGRTIAGTILYQNGTAINGAVITVSNSGKTFETTTDAEGNYIIPNLKEGSYTTEVMITNNGLTLKATGILTVGAGSEAAEVSFAPDEIGATDIENSNLKQTGMMLDGADVTILNTSNINGENNDVKELLETLELLDPYQDSDSIMNAENKTQILESILELADNYYALFPAEKAQLGEENIVRYEELIQLFLECYAMGNVQEYVDASEAGVEVTQEGLGDIAIRELTPTQLHAAMESAEGHEIQFILYVADVTAQMDTALEEDKEMINNLAGTAYVGSIYNIDVESQLCDADGTTVANSNTNVKELDGLIMIEMEVPAHQQAQYYAVAHVHSGTPELIPVQIIRGQDGESDIIRFYTEKFSTYAIISSDTVIYGTDGNALSTEVAGTQGVNSNVTDVANGASVIENPALVTPEAALYSEITGKVPEIQENEVIVVAAVQANAESGYHPYIPVHEDNVKAVSDTSYYHNYYLDIPVAKTEEQRESYFLWYLIAMILTGILGYIVLKEKDIVE